MQYWINGKWVDEVPAAAVSQHMQTIVNFGAIPSHGQEFIINSPTCTSSSRIMVSMAYIDTVDNSADEIEMSGLWCCAGQPGPGSFKVFVGASDGPVTGHFAVNYILG